ncbi:hypothetical protein Afer_0866 [Acidimicrobium ferrooxidans DSM 10331]|uniref:Uncharacterized protein n=1 Tax=Acidimicrobium ferrooxidans (strain DSM 10331 / JCM 15462 / NBRC 103882 / ICP) TaxID=525909 RepID=C7LYK3_ACIFD|nr:hypothetical protein Afer_0866 [Acidimicrobium ferrooxidans DSM 10331]
MTVAYRDGAAVARRSLGASWQAIHRPNQPGECNGRVTFVGWPSATLWIVARVFSGG